MSAKPEFGRSRRWSNEPLVLFVEGSSDLVFYAELLEHVGLFEKNFIQELGGKGRKKLKDEALLLLKPDNLARMKAVAVLLDADANAEGAFTLARGAIKDATGFEIPEAGKWFEQAGAGVRFGVFVVGGADGNGELETLAWDAWKASADNASLLRCVEEFVKCASGNGIKLRSIDKVRVGALLAVLNEDDPRLGAGARAGVFDFSAPEFERLVAFFSELKPLL